MQITLLCIGKTDNNQLLNLIETYTKRLGHYVKFKIKILPDIKKTKSLSINQQKQKEGELLLLQFQTSDHVLLLDEKGQQYTSVSFSKLIQKKLNGGYKQLYLVIGGPYGFSEDVYARAQQKIALSSMTFSHQMVRLLAVEQLYRAFTILKGEPYHHQ